MKIKVPKMPAELISEEEVKVTIIEGKEDNHAN